MSEPPKISGNWLTHDSVRINLNQVSTYWVTCQMVSLISNGVQRDIWFPDMPRADSPPIPYGQAAREFAEKLDAYFSNYCHSNA